jgi:hypothetical protein
MSKKYFKGFGWVKCIEITPFEWVSVFGFDINPETGCWEWNRCRDRNGYGKFKYKEHQLAHRVSYLFHKGDPAGLEVCHHCDNPCCINPEHLFLGTHDDNMKDAAKKQRCGIPQHPSLSAYKQGCRCDECKKINYEYKKEWASKPENREKKRLQSIEYNKRTKEARAEKWRIKKYGS